MPAKKLAEIPEELKLLNPKESTENVMVGEEGYELYPLTEGEAEVIAKCLSDMGEMIFGQLKKTLGNRTEPGSAEYVGALINVCAEALVASGKIREIVATCLDLDPEEIQKKMTVAQLLHFAGAVVKQNFDLSALPEVVRKNLKAVRSAFTPSTPLPLALSMEEIGDILAADSYPPEEKVERIVESVNRHSIFAKPIQTSFSATDGPETTSKDDGTESVG